MDMSFFESLSTGAGGGAATIALGWMFLKKTYNDICKKIEENEKWHKEFAEHVSDRFERGEKEFTRLDKDIIQGLNEIKLSQARLEEKNNIGKDIAEAIVLAIRTQK